jgi:hypothetical protein
MKFDGIIACGDSYTIGPVTKGSLSMDKSWPAHLGNIMNLPVVNLSRGGSSNTEISLQPLKLQKQFENPLIIFGFTIHYRFPYFNNKGSIHSMYGMLDSDFEFEHSRSSNSILLAKDWMQKFLLPTDNGLSGTENMLIASIERIFAYEKLNPNSKVIWGVLHSDSPDGPAIPNNILNHIPKEYMDSCFNIDNKPYENISYIDHTISDTDQHPNSDGLKKYAEAIHHFINS